MGLRASLVGVRNADKKLILDKLGLVETGEYAFATFPELSCAVTPSGWFVVTGPEDFVTHEKLAQLSSAGEAVALISSETVMVNEAHGYIGGRKTWSVTHNPERGSRDLEVEGDVPAQIAEIRSRLTRRQDEDEEGGVDFLFDAAIELVDSICGYRWDQANPDGEAVLMVLERAEAGAAGERQAQRHALNSALSHKVEDELYALARSQGYERAQDRPDFLAHHTPITTFNTFVRERGGAWDSLTFVWDVDREGPKVAAYFFVRPLSKRRDGRSGLAHPQMPRRSFLDQLLGRNKPAPETVDSIVDKMAGVMVELDAHLKVGKPSSNIIPAVYYD